MFIKTLYNKIINSAWITEIYISEPEFDQDTFNVCIKVHLNGVYILAECKTKAEAEERLNGILNELNGK